MLFENEISCQANSEQNDSIESEGMLFERNIHFGNIEIEILQNILRWFIYFSRKVDSILYIIYVTLHT